MDKIIQLILCDKDWFSNYFFSFLDLIEIAKLDSAFVNYSIRLHWLKCSKRLNCPQIRLSNNSEVTWCIRRNLCLTKLTINATDINDTSFIKLATYCRQLIHLNMSLNDSISFIGISTLFQHCGQLQHIHLVSSNTITNDNLFTLGVYCHQLSHVHIEWCNQISNDGIDSLLKGCGQQLKSFYFYCHTDSSLLSFQLFKILGTYCPILCSLYLENLHVSCDKESIDIFTATCKLLQSLELELINGLSNELIIKVGQNFAFLETIILREYLQVDIGDVGINSLLHGCGLLKILEINAQLPNITDDAFVQLSVYCPHLENVKINSIHMTNKTLAEIGKLKCLRSIDIMGMHKITDVGVIQLLQGHVAATFTDRDNNSYATNIDNNRSSNNIPSISCLEDIKLYIDVEQRITQQSVYTIANYCSSLKSICIDDYDDILPMDCIQYLVDHCLQLISIDGYITITDSIKEELLIRRRLQNNIE